MTTVKTKRDPEGTKRRILLAALDAFAAGGLSGARVDQIAQQARTNERMLYYYFGSKEQLFIAVLEHAYSEMVEAERQLDLKDANPVEVVTRLAHFTWDFYAENPGFVRLINNENLHEARYLRQSTHVRESFSPILTALSDALESGQKQGIFREDIDPMRVYLTMTGNGYYSVSNRHTISAMMGRDISAAEEREALFKINLEMLLDYLKKR
jgi:AcrR family transcriptional regulator